jgi:hypothetical protein
MSGKLNLGGIDLVKLYGELRWIEDKADRFPNLYRLYLRLSALPEVRRVEERRILRKFIREVGR